MRSDFRDRIRAKRLLEAREHGFAVLPFFRRGARRYVLYFLPSAVVLGFLAFGGWWWSFGMVASFLLGALLFYVRWFRGQQRVWSFVNKVIDWDIVTKLSNGEPLA